MSSISTAIPITESSQVGEARRLAVSLGSNAGLNEIERGEVAIAVTEAATNILRHTNGGGQIVLRVLTVDGDGRDGLEVLALDTGPGLINVENAFRDGYSTAGTAGQGLGAIRRLASHFDLYTHPDSGTALLARFYGTRSHAAVAPGGTNHFPQFGVVSLPKPGEEGCGDGWAVGYGPGRDDDVLRFIVADGLGHGQSAAEASHEAVQVFREQEGETGSPKQLMELMHSALRGTRGAAAAIVFVEPLPEGVVRFCGIGNIMSALLSPQETRNMASYNGIVGDQVRQFQEFTYPCPTHAGVLVMASDGLTTRWRLDQYPGIWGKHPALIAGILYRDFYRGRDDATVLVASIPANSGENPASEETP